MRPLAYSYTVKADDNIVRKFKKKKKKCSNDAVQVNGVQGQLAAYMFYVFHFRRHLNNNNHFFFLTINIYCIHNNVS